ncbi:uncharacterized protein LOC111402047 isoform X2 [Olea europaea var. sylvestris]|uniref:uncharacterized protein LOC111402047 isoform X2 n=1 Tax=Olea europaea var. sylvestris TaxID=158386 RepID=UPI000C1CE5BF|nr:uncharacterized protein LOC111402047 isoform X2 [Olea europaea var. sylvestris]
MATVTISYIQAQVPIHIVFLVSNQLSIFPPYAAAVTIDTSAAAFSLHPPQWTLLRLKVRNTHTLSLSLSLSLSHTYYGDSERVCGIQTVLLLCFFPERSHLQLSYLWIQSKPELIQKEYVNYWFQIFKIHKEGDHYIFLCRSKQIQSG